MGKTFHGNVSHNQRLFVSVCVGTTIVAMFRCDTHLQKPRDHASLEVGKGMQRFFEPEGDGISNGKWAKTSSKKIEKLLVYSNDWYFLNYGNGKWVKFEYINSFTNSFTSQNHLWTGISVTASWIETQQVFYGHPVELEHRWYHRDGMVYGSEGPPNFMENGWRSDGQRAIFCKF